MNQLYRELPALHARDYEPEGFEWVKLNDSDNSVLAYLRRGAGNDWVLIVANFTPVPREQYVVGVPLGGGWEEIFNSDAAEYGGSGIGNRGFALATDLPYEGRAHQLSLRVPPLGAVFLRAKH